MDYDPLTLMNFPTTLLTLFILFFSETVFQTSVDHIIARQEQKLHCIKLPGKTETTDPCLPFRKPFGLTREKMQNGFMTETALSSIPLVFAAQLIPIFF